MTDTLGTAEDKEYGGFVRSLLAAHDLYISRTEMPIVLWVLNTQLNTGLKPYARTLRAMKDGVYTESGVRIHGPVSTQQKAIGTLVERLVERKILLIEHKVGTPDVFSVNIVMILEELQDSLYLDAQTTVPVNGERVTYQDFLYTILKNMDIFDHHTDLMPFLWVCQRTFALGVRVEETCMSCIEDPIQLNGKYLLQCGLRLTRYALINAFTRLCDKGFITLSHGNWYNEDSVTITLNPEAVISELKGAPWVQGIDNSKPDTDNVVPITSTKH